LPQAGPAISQIRIVIPDGHSMVGLLGTSDELLQVIEREFGPRAASPASARPTC
jgi:hypothetical protein